MELSVEEDANISLFRRRNKIIILVLLFLIISSALIIGALILEILRIHNSTTTTSTHESSGLFSPIRSFCSVSESQSECLEVITPIIENTVIVDPDQILIISLQASLSQIQKIISDSDSPYKNCSHTMSHAFNQLGAPLAAMRLNPFVSSLSHEQRGEIWKRVVAAEEDVKSCIDHNLAADELVQVGVYLNSAQNYLFKYARVLSRVTVYTMSGSGSIYNYLFEMCMCGLQVLFMFGMFFALFRIRR